MSQKSIPRLVEGWASAWASGNPDSLVALFVDDCVYEDVPTQRVNRGKSEILAFAKAVMTGFPGFRFEVSNCFVTQDGAGVEWLMVGTHSGDYPGLPATGKSLRIRGASIMVFEKDKLRRVSDYWDFASSGLVPGDTSK